MKHNNLFILFTTIAVAVSTLTGCGGAKKDSSKDQTSPAAAPSTPAKTTENAPAATPNKEDAEATFHDETADAAIETYLNGIKTGNLDLSIAVLVPDTPGMAELVKMKVGWDKAAASGAPIEMAKAVMAGEIDALKYQKISDDGAFATFRFTKPTSDTPWEIQVIKTPEGWRVKPPDSGMPQG